MFKKRRDARRAQLRVMWQKYLTDTITDRTDVEAIRAALVTFILTNHVRRSDAEWLVHG